MIASRPFRDAFRFAGRNALDLPVAALSALAVLFVAFAMPGDLLADLVGATGLPSLLSSARPPLGMTARIAIGGAGAAAAFGLVFLLLRMLDRAMLGDGERGTPKPRRRDAHPDAPAPRPISAAQEFGEPAPPVRPQSEPTPVWLAEAQPVPDDAETVVEAKPEPAPTESLTELMARLERGLARHRAPAAAAAPAPQVFPQAGDDRLQSAIDSLQRLAARHP